MATKNEEAVRQKIEQWAQTVRDADMEKVIALHTNDVVMFDVIPPFQINGLKEFRKTWELFFKFSKGGDGSFNLSDLRIRAEDSLAFATAKLHVASLEVRLTLGLINDNGEWKIAHEHHSILEDEEE